MNSGVPLGQRGGNWLLVLLGHCHPGVSFNKVTKNHSQCYTEIYCLRSFKGSHCYFHQTSIFQRLQSDVPTSFPAQSPSQRAPSPLREAQTNSPLEFLAPGSLATKALVSSCPLQRSQSASGQEEEKFPQRPKRAPGNLHSPTQITPPHDSTPRSCQMCATDEELMERPERALYPSEAKD